MNETLNREELKILLFLVRNRLRYESQRPVRVRQGHDIQAEKVWELKELQEKLERMV